MVSHTVLGSFHNLLAIISAAEVSNKADVNTSNSCLPLATVVIPPASFRYRMPMHTVAGLLLRTS